ncbi:MAG: alcohol dehydrogenase catalytic domain-containing protein [Herpetosiphonaceae bacterium]|nr:alcohol dehydrogenase catalytic domain-containing protein [Herpetosiphonaceae bacterium]
MNMRDQPDPELGADEALIKVAFAGICGSELSGYLGHNALRVPPLIMGHEFSGEIVALGPASAEREPHLTSGQWVTVNPMLACGSCSFCQSGREHLCSTRQLVGAARPGAFAEYVCVPLQAITPLPTDFPLRSGALVEPVAVGVRIGEVAGPLGGEDTLVIGAGPIGLLALQAFNLQGAERVFITDRDPARLEMGRALGGTVLDARSQDVVEEIRTATGRRGVAVAVDAVGLAQTRAQAVATTRSAGTVILSGLHEESSTMPAADIIRRELVVRGCFCYSHANFAEALDRLSRGAVRLDPWIVEAPLADGGMWFERLIDAPGNVAKVLLIP